MGDSKSYLVVDPCQISAPYNFCLLDGLVKEGASVIYASSDFAHEDMPDPDGIQRFRCFFLLATFVQKFFPSQKLRRVVRAAEYPFDLVVLVAFVLFNRIRVIHFMWTLSPTFDALLYKLLQAFGCRIVYTAHNAFPHEHESGQEKRFSRLYRTVDHLIVLTQNTADEILQVCDLPSDRISVIPHGDFGALHAKYPCNEDLAKQIREKANGKKIISFLGIIRPYKGLSYFTQSWPLIRDRMPGSFFLVAGSLSIGDREKIEESFRQHGQPDGQHIDIRFLPTSDLKACIAVTDVLVLPYVSASQSGNTVMAYAAGIPVVATDVGGLAEMTKDNETGFVVPPKDPAAIADAVCKCFEPDRYDELSARATYVATHEFSWSTIAKKTIHAYDGRAETATTSVDLEFQLFESQHVDG